MKWTPNPMLRDDSLVAHEEKTWNQPITVDLADVVYLHCHSSGEKFNLPQLV